MKSQLLQNPEIKREHLVPPVKLALVYLNKPLDVALTAQLTIATGHIETTFVGKSMDYKHKKVADKVASWGFSKESIKSLPEDKVQTVTELIERNPNSRLIGCVVSGGSNPFEFDWSDEDILVIGGANGLSRADQELMDGLVTIPTTEATSFMTVSNVVSALTYHILTQRGLWNKIR